MLKMETTAPDRDYRQRRGELSAFGRAVNAINRIKWLLVALAAVCVAIALVSLFMPQLLPVPVALLAVLLLVAGGGFYIWTEIHRHLIEPELATRKWIQNICDGELRSTIELPETHAHFKELDFHTRNVGTSLRRLSEEMETLVENQTQRLERQNRVLQLLFQLTSDVAHEIDQQSVLNTVCHSLADWLTDSSVGAYMVVDDELQLQAASDPAEFIDQYSTSMLVTEVTLAQEGLKIPILRGKEALGVLLVVTKDRAQLERRGSQQVFKSLSEQLSMFVAKHYVLESVQQARVVKERAMLGAEIHDSLAQTLLACRYQIRMLRESLTKNGTAELHKDIERIEGTIGEANVELRELIGQTRQATAEQPVASAIQQMLRKHNTSGGIPVFFQNDNPHVEFSTREASVVQRIVREALVNANKYSNATTVRVCLRVDHTGVRSLLVEDDGDGFDLSSVNKSDNVSADALGDHIGLAIMRDRALSIGAILEIDSEPGEGTRIYLKLPPVALEGNHRE